MSLSVIKFLPIKAFLFRGALALAIVGFISLQPVYAQATASDAAAPAISPVDAPTPDVAPVSSKGFWHHSKSTKDLSIKASKKDKIDAKISNGVLTVDGFVAKVELNYNIQHAKYLYFYAPGVGTVVVSRMELPGATRVKDAIHGSSVDFTVAGHSFSLENDATVASMAVIVENPDIKVKKEKMREVHDAFVVLDENAQALYSTPQIGYGDTNVAPYAFPLSGEQPKSNYAHFVQPPPMPSNLLPRTKATQSGGTGGK
jgi:hypothetical protein